MVADAHDGLCASPSWTIDVTVTDLANTPVGKLDHFASYYSLISATLSGRNYTRRISSQTGFTFEV